MKNFLITMIEIISRLCISTVILYVVSKVPIDNKGMISFVIFITSWATIVPVYDWYYEYKKEKGK